MSDPRPPVPLKQGQSNLGICKAVRGDWRSGSPGRRRAMRACRPVIRRRPPDLHCTMTNPPVINPIGDLNTPLGDLNTPLGDISNPQNFFPKHFPGKHTPFPCLPHVPTQHAGNLRSYDVTASPMMYPSTHSLPFPFSHPHPSHLAVKNKAKLPGIFFFLKKKTRVGQKVRA